MRLFLTAAAMIAAWGSTEALSATVTATCRIEGNMLVVDMTSGFDYPVVCLAACDFVEQSVPQTHSCTVTIPGAGTRSCLRMVKPETTAQSEPTSLVCTTVNQHTTF